MSSTFEFFGNTMIYPKLNVLILTRSGERILFNLNFLKWYFISSFVIGAYFIFKLIKRVPGFLRKIYLKFKPLLLDRKNFAIIFGFGDSLASVKVTKALINLGFKFILINKKDSKEHRKKYNLNKFEGIEELDKEDVFLSYEEIVENPEALIKKIGDEKINYIFDFTSFRINVDIDKINEESQELLLEKFNQTSQEKDGNILKNDKFNEEEKLKVDFFFNDNKGQTSPNSFFGNNDSIKKLSQSSLQYYNSRIFYSEEISKYIKEIMLITETMIPHMNYTRILIFNYKEKNSDINHKLIVDYKNNLFKNIKNLANKKGNYIRNVKVMTGLINYKYSQFTEEDGLNVIRFSNSGYYDYLFS